MHQSAQGVVVRFCQAWERRSQDDVTSLMDDQIVYQNVPGAPMNGKVAALEFIAPILAKTTHIDFQLLKIATAQDGATVLTERVDRLHFPNGIVEIPIMGVFVIADGKIREWRDYADSAHVGAQFAKLSAMD